MITLRLHIYIVGVASWMCVSWAELTTRPE
jgi:hypothetical protein